MGLISAPQAFASGHNLSYCAVYFDQVLLAAKLANVKNTKSSTHAQQMIASLQKVGGNFAKRLQQVDGCAQLAKLSSHPLPALPPEFYPWANTRHAEFLQHWPATDPHGCLFVIGHALGELRNGLIIANLTMDFSKNLKLDFEAQISEVPKRLSEAMTRLERGVQILENLPQPHSSTQLLRPIVNGLHPQIKTSTRLIELHQAALDKALSLNHKLLQILSATEVEIGQHLSTPPS